MRIVKSAVSVALLLFSLGVIATIQEGSLFPWIILGTGAALAVLCGCIAINLDRSAFGILLGTTLMFAVLYRVHIFTFPASLVGIDSHDFAIWLEQVLESGGLQGTSAAGFYTDAGGYLTLNAIGALLLGVGSSTAFVLMSVIIGTGTVLFGAALTYRLVPMFNYTSAAAAATASGFIAASIRAGYWPIPQSLAAVFFVSFIFVLTAYVDNFDSRCLFLSLLLLIALATTHKLALIFVVVTLFYVIVLIYLHSIKQKVPRRAINSICGMVLLSGILLYTQMSSTGYITSIVYRVVALSNVSVTQITPTAAVPPMDPFYIGIHSTGYALVLMSIAGIGWMFLATQRPTPEQIILLGAASAIVTLGFSGMIVKEFGFRRAMDYGGVVLVVLILTSVVTLYDRRALRVPCSVSMAGIVAILLIASLAAPAATPDYEHYPRDYLTSSEYNAVTFADSHVTGEVHSDFLTTRVGAPAGLPDEQREPTYQSADSSHFNGKQVEGKYVLLRPTVDVYDTGPLPTEAPMYRLTWDPEMAYNKSYHRTYSSGGGVIYTNQTTTS